MVRAQNFRSLTQYWTFHTTFHTYIGYGGIDESWNQRSVMPLQGPPPAEIALPRAPLVSVVAQVQFQMHLPIRDPQRVAAFQEAIADRYPHLEPQNVNVMMLSMQAPQQMVQPEFVIGWRFSDLERNWRITLTPEFITLDTRAYQNRADFSERFEEILQALEDTLKAEADNAVWDALHQPD